MLCGKYIGDNDATTPQLTCIRFAGHEGLCDNVRPDCTLCRAQPRARDHFFFCTSCAAAVNRAAKGPVRQKCEHGHGGCSLRICVAKWAGVVLVVEPDFNPPTWRTEE